MKEYVNEFQNIVKVVPGAAQEDTNVNIKDYNTIIICNNTASNIISWENEANGIQPNDQHIIKGNENEYLTGVLKIILFEQVVGFPAPRCVLIKKKYIDAKL
jgi:hypothetical protein